MSKTVTLLLREDIENLGNCGDVVTVAAGYARNYLLPRHYAEAASAENVKMIARRRERFDAARAERMKEFEVKKNALEGVSLTTIERADQDGHLYGSVNAAAIVKLLAEAGHTVEERNVLLDGPIKSVGATEVVIRIYADMRVTLPLTVDPEGGYPEPEPEPEAPAEREERIEMPEGSLNE
ncbi:MAG: 50S ribosomal protein L9 [Planctomycetota bacterium]|nr:50S ribosomal protein L9 [Planctomycetota bacterium]MDG2142493.1 50S ribosomal protein L9 [Planctomycetota bacterium]